MKVVRDLIEAADEMLRFGNHDGPCAFIEPDGKCFHHSVNMKIRISNLRDAIENARKERP